ncbi:MAG: hypothetical protein Q9195_002384 [Heterodermia aff. obscurata]
MPPTDPSPIVDIHTHIYPPSYISLLSSRSSPPQLLQLPPTSPDATPPPPRLIILPSDSPSANPSTPISHLGRPIGPEYSSVPHILSFMNTHHITTSILSLANPWLDFLPPHESAPWAHRINTELCTISATSSGRISAFGILPLTAPLPSILSELSFLTSPACSPHIKGLILGTTGLGAGLDDPALDPIFSALQHPSPLLLFIHPHYGLPSEVFGPRMQQSGHVLPLALGFPLETTIAFTRMWLAGVFDRFPGLRVLLAHAGGAVPALAGRVGSCVEHERGFYGDGEGEEEAVEGKGKGKRKRGPKRSLETVLRENVYLDAVSYSATGVKAAVEVVGRERVLFGTDHPFFPPVGGGAPGEGEEEDWTSVTTNVEAVKNAFGPEDVDGIRAVLGGNAIRLFGLDVESGDKR